jgi:hypothetical protein
VSTSGSLPRRGLAGRTALRLSVAQGTLKLPGRSIAHHPLVIKMGDPLIWGRYLPSGLRGHPGSSWILATGSVLTVSLPGASMI